MRVFSISDLHLSINSNKPMDIFGPVWENYLSDIEQSWQNNVQDDDIVLIPGDISWAMRFEDALPDLEYISKWKGHKVILRGNHDYWWKGISALREQLPPKMYALQNDAIRLGNIVICGSRGWVVPETTHKTPDDERIYNREAIRLELSLKHATTLKQDGDTVICITHFPPFNSRYADSDYTRLMEKYGVNYAVFGHLHSYDKKQKLTLEKNGIKYFLTSCDLVNNQLIEII